MTTLTTICIVGAAPGGLLLARLLKSMRPAVEVTVLEAASRAASTAAHADVSRAARELIGEYDADIAPELACAGPVQDYLLARCTGAGVRLDFSSAVATHIGRQGFDLVVLDSAAYRAGRYDLVPGLAAKLIVIRRHGPGGLAGLRSAMAVFDTIWNASYDIATVLHSLHHASQAPCRPAVAKGTPWTLPPASLHTSSHYSLKEVHHDSH